MDLAKVIMLLFHTWLALHSTPHHRVTECRLLEEVLLTVAKKFKEVKFVKIVSTAAVENWPDRNLPTLFLYHDGELQTQMLGLKKLGGRSTTAAGKAGGARP